jgi:hypothetical protein
MCKMSLCVGEMGNPQPSSYVRYDEDREKVQRLNGSGSYMTV